MTHRSLEDKLQAAASPVEMARNSQIGPYVYPAVPAEFSNWRDEQVSWMETSALFDQSHHMTDLQVEGPDVIALLSATGINSFESFKVDKAKQYVAVNHDGYVIGDGILFFLDENAVRLVGRPSAHNWLQYHAETGGYDVSLSRDERTAVNPTGGRELYRFQVQGPTALDVLKKANGGSLPEVKFFNMGELTIGGRKVRALHHGMSGVPGMELFGPWAEREDVRGAIIEAGKDFGLQQVGSRVYATNTLESGWIPCPLPAVFTGDEMKAYREWLPADGYEGTGSLGGSYYSDDIADYYLTPHELGYWPFVKFDHDFIGREALEAMGDEACAAEGHAGVERRGRRECDRVLLPEGRTREVHRLPALQLLDLAERQGPEGRRHGRRLDVLGVQLQRALVPLARDDRRRRRDRQRGHPRLGRGGRRLVEAGRRTARADRDPRNRQPVPVRRGRPELVPRGLADEGRGLEEGLA